MKHKILKKTIIYYSKENLRRAEVNIFFGNSDLESDRPGT